MTKIDVLKFKNSPVITTELAKCLALNSSFESVEKLQGSVTSNTDNIAKAVKEPAAAAKTANTAGNIVDTLKGDLKGLAKRVKTLEGNRP